MSQDWDDELEMEVENIADDESLVDRETLETPEWDQVRLNALALERKHATSVLKNWLPDGLAPEDFPARTHPLLAHLLIQDLPWDTLKTGLFMAYSVARIYEVEEN